MKLNYYSPCRHCWVRVSDWRDGEAELSNVFTSVGHRGKGLARALMREVCADADREGVTLLLTVGHGRGPGGDGLRSDQLYEWYTRLGFHGLAGGSGDSYARTRMERPPYPVTVVGEKEPPAQKAQRNG